MVLGEMMARVGRALTTPLWGGRAQVAPSMPVGDPLGEARYSSVEMRRDAAAWLRVYKRNSRVRGPVHRIAEDVASVRWHVKRAVGRSADGSPVLVEVLDHRLLDLWERPNPMMTGVQMRELLTVWLEMTGRAPLFVERDPDDENKTPDGYGVRPLHLWPVRPQDLIHMPSESEPFWRFRLRGRHRTRKCRPQDLILLRQVDVEDPYGFGGAGASEAVNSEVTQDEFSARWNTNGYRNGSRLGKVIGVPGLKSKEARELQLWYEANHCGVDNSHRDLFINSELRVQDLGANHKDLDFIEGRKLLRDMIAQNWNVPPEVLGIVENSNRATADAALNFHQRQNVKPRLVGMESWVNLYLVPLFRDPALCLVADDPVQESADFIHRTMTDGLVRGAVTVDEWRERHGLNPLGGEVGGRLYVPLNIAQVEAESGLAQQVAAQLADLVSGRQVA